MRLVVPCLIALLSSALLAADTPNNSQSSKPSTRLDIASGTLISGSGAPIEVRSFKTTIEKGENHPGRNKEEKSGPTVVTIASGTAFLTVDSLSKLLNSKFGERGLQDIKVSEDKGRVKITGTAKKKVSVPFTIEGPITLAPNGFIRLGTEKVQVAKLPGLADLLGVKPDKLVGDGSVKGVKAEKDAILFDPDLLWGLPVHGRVTRLAFNGKGLLLVFGEQKPSAGKR